MTDERDKARQWLAIVAAMAVGFSGCRALDSYFQEEDLRQYQKEIDDWNEKHPDKKIDGGII